MWLITGSAMLVDRAKDNTGVGKGETLYAGATLWGVLAIAETMTAAVIGFKMMEL